MTVLPVQQVYGGSPYSDAYQPLKSDIIRYLKALEAAIEGGDLSGLAVKSYVVAFNVRGTANSITADTDIPVPTQDGGALIALPIQSENTASPVTVSFNGGAPLTIKTNAGYDLEPGALTVGMIAAGYKSGDDFRLITDNVSSTILAAMQSEAARAETARTEAETAQVGAEAAEAEALNQANRAESEAHASQASATQAQDLVQQATAGFTGFEQGQAYDFGYVTDATTYFDQDWGSITDPVA